MPVLKMDGHFILKRNCNDCLFTKIDSYILDTTKINARNKLKLLSILCLFSSLKSNAQAKIVYAELGGPGIEVRFWL